jgi:hypothetical protein
MGEPLLPAARSTLSTRAGLARRLTAVRRMSLEAAIGWCDAWEEHAARSGMSSKGPYFWDSALGWIDAQLYVAPTENGRTSARVAAGARARQR